MVGITSKNVTSDTTDLKVRWDGDPIDFGRDRNFVYVVAPPRAANHISTVDLYSGNVSLGKQANYQYTDKNVEGEYVFAPASNTNEPTPQNQEKSNQQNSGSQQQKSTFSGVDLSSLSTSKIELYLC